MNKRKWKILVIGSLIYLSYVIMFSGYLVNTSLPIVLFGKVIDSYIFVKSLAVCFPVYLTIIVLSESSWANKDFLFFLSPVTFWLVATLIITGGKSGSNFYLFEPESVLVFSGIYLLKISLVKYGLSEIKARRILLSVLFLYVLFIVLAIPPMGE